jgi:HPt (histidine-containing phosphotransfer) domain-containing protein
LDDIAGALAFAGMERESKVMAQCRSWLEAASKGGSVHEDDAFRCFAGAFAEIELHLQRSIMDPLEDTSHMLALAEQRAQELGRYTEELSVGADITTPAAAEAGDYVEDTDLPPEIRAVFIEEADEIIQDLTRLNEEWAENPQANAVLRDIRRHFHTFKGNGRAVGANVLGELGWAAQDMLDHVLDGDLEPGELLRELVAEVVRTLPSLVSSYKGEQGLDVARTRELTNRCFSLASGGAAAVAPDLPGAVQVTDSPVRLVTSTPVSEPVSH